MRTRFAAALVLACAGFAQTPAFEVASVKIAEPITPEMVQSGRLQIGITIDALNVRMNKISLFDLTRTAYQVKPHQISGPAWMAAERYDIQAKMPEGAPRSQLTAMLQTLLAERFGMRIHRETRDFSVYALVVATGGPHLQPASTDDAAPVAPEGQLRANAAVGPGGAISRTGPVGNSVVTPGPNGNLHIETRKMNLFAFADFINRYCDRPVLDMTGIQGNYDMEFDVSADEVRDAARAHGAVIRPAATAAGDAPEPSSVSLASSLRRLGLKRESRKAPSEVIVIDKVEKIPTAN